MRLWHYKLIPFLPRQQLLGQHRECCALRGLGWGKKHSTVDYVFKHSYLKLAFYHLKIMQEMQQRGYNIDRQWLHISYRGKALGYIEFWRLPNIDKQNCSSVYEEHSNSYLVECINNLLRKGIDLMHLLSVEALT